MANYTEMKYKDPYGNEQTGYSIDGHVYKDQDGTQPIDYGSVVQTAGGAYRMGSNGGVKVGSSADWQDRAQNYMQMYGARDPFKFELNKDALYQQYKDQYTKLGKMAMEDIIGQAAGLTGGYGNTYAQNVGQQAYNAYLDRLNDVIPDIYAQQRADYDAQGEALYNQWAMANQMYGNARAAEDTAYEREWNEAGREHDWNQQEWQNQWNEQGRQHDWEQAAKEDAQNAVWAAIQAGLMPSDDLITASGYTPEYVQTMSQWYASNMTKEEAQNQVDALLAVGQKPSDELIAASGYSQEYVNGMITAYRLQHPTGGGGGGNQNRNPGNPGTPTPPKDDDGDDDDNDNPSGSGSPNGSWGNSGVGGLQWAINNPYPINIDMPF